MENKEFWENLQTNLEIVPPSLIYNNPPGLEKSYFLASFATHNNTVQATNDGTINSTQDSTVQNSVNTTVNNAENSTVDATQDSGVNSTADGTIYASRNVSVK
jgi:hypothetical protein